MQIKSNIGIFHGNGSHITVYAENVGATAAVALLLHKSQKPLFQNLWAVDPAVNLLTAGTNEKAT